MLVNYFWAPICQDNLMWPKRRPKDSTEQSFPITGIARVDYRTKNLTKRLNAGEVAVIDHEDLDLVSAEALVECRPAVVLNAARSTSGKYPNLGPVILNEAGICLIDDLGPAVMDIAENTPLVVNADGEVSVNGEVVASGSVQTTETIEANRELAKAGMPEQLKSFATNTMEYVEREQDLILDGMNMPQVRTKFNGKHALIVVRGYRYKDDLAALRGYIREYKPIMIGVDGGADAILEAGLPLDMIVGDMDSVSDKALKSGAEIVVHAYRDGRAPGKHRVEELGVEHVIFPATGTSEDIAMLLADDKGASLIVALGTHSTLIEFFDKGRRGMASTFLTRLQVGSKLIDAKGVSQLYRSRVSNWQIAFLLIAGIVVLVAALAATDAGQILFQLVGVWFSDITLWFNNLF